MAAQTVCVQMEDVHDEGDELGLLDLDLDCDLDLNSAISNTLPRDTIATGEEEQEDTVTEPGTPLHHSTAQVHKHRLCHNPSKLPGLRFVDRGRALVQNNPPAGHRHPGHPSLPQPAVSPPCPTGVDTRQDPVKPTNPHPHPDQGTGSGTGTGTYLGTINTANSSHMPAGGLPQSRLAPVGTVALVADPPRWKPSRPVIQQPLPPPPALNATSSLLHPVTEADEISSQSADDVCTEPVPLAKHRGRRASVHKHSPQYISIVSPIEPSPPSQASTLPSSHTASTAAPVTTPISAKSGRSASLRINDATTAAASPANSSPLAPRSEVTRDSWRLYTQTSHPRPRRNSSWDCTSNAARPPGRRNLSWDLTSASSPPSSCANKSTSTDEWAPGQPKVIFTNPVISSLSNENSNTLSRRTSSASRPPISSKPLPPGYVTPGCIPPIRSFRSSGSRKSHPLAMDNSSIRYHDDVGDGHDQKQSPRESPRDRSLRALEGRITNDTSRDVAKQDLDDDVAESENNTADIFMNIAREDSYDSVPHREKDRSSDDEQSTTVSRVVRTARTPRSRPLSVYSSIQKPHSSPPPVSRRLSDHQVPTTRTTRRAPEELSEQQQANRDASYQNSATGRPSLKLDSSRGPSRVPSLKPSPITPRTQSVLDNSADRNSIFARRPSTRAGEGHSRSASIKQPSGLSKSFNSSPLVPKNGVLHQTPNGQYVEASESSNSTAAPSTVWDELDELKSRIHRLELTGKMPKTSSAAISRTPEERPPTAGTGATTLSGSPKRAQTEIISMASAQKETQSNLQSILSKTRPFVSSDVYDAIEAAANDALSLSQLMGSAGQPGPISSGASTIGAGGSSTITDRQLRKKADSICRSLTELCIALKEEEPDRRTNSTSRPQTRGTSRNGRDDIPSSPPAMRVFNGTGPDEPVTSIESYSSPRVTRLDKRATFNFTGMNGISNEPSPRYASSVAGGEDDNTMTGRKSSLVLARARRGVTEDPEDQGRKTSLLRTRRTASEEPEEQEGGRRSSMVFAPRRVTTIGRVSNIDEEPQMQSRAPSRAFTEVSNARTEVGNGLRINVPTRDSIARRPLAHEPVSASSALPRTRLITSGLPTPGPYSSRLMTPTTPGGRRFLQVNRQQAQEDNNNNNTSNFTGRLAEERGQRYSIAVPPSSAVTRGPSLHRKRHSGIPNISGTASNVGGYR